MDFHHMERDRPKKASLIKVRLVIAILATLCPVVCYITRQNLSFAIVSMIDDTTAGGPDEAGALENAAGNTVNKLPDSILGDDLGLLTMDISPNNTVPASTTNSTKARPAKAASSLTSGKSNPLNAEQTCPEPIVMDESGKTTILAKAKTYGPRYRWSPQDKGYAQGAFFITYVIFQIPGARMAELAGPKWILAAASLGSAVLSFVSPWAASQHVYLFMAARLIMGAFQAAIYPACFVLYSKWLPPVERSQGLPILCVGAYVGSIIASFVTGYFSEHESFGWEYSFYVPAVLCLVWSFAWIWFGSNEPRDHKYISIEELQSIELRMESSTQQRVSSSALEGLEAAGLDTRQSAEQLSAAKDISWYKLATSSSIWVMMVAFFASNWSFSIVLLTIPTYLDRILRVSPMDNSVVNSIIYVIYCGASPLVGAVSTMMVETRTCGLSRLSIRKLFQGTALLGQAVCFMAVVWIGCDRTLVFAVLYVQIVFFSLVNGGEVQLPNELSVDFSGTIYAIGNCVGSSTGFIVPFVNSQIVTDPYSRAQWDAFFYTAAVITALGGLVFMLFGQNKMQDFTKDLDNSQLDFVKFGGLAAARKGSR